ncbi:MAG: HAMP domain-containing sensor histidine kinase [Candidatus Gastranaerophilales bacterium]|nr:HAMP domain-containing sensor histidine kinase [Candidatus Gastranaerophilales bacterium]
MLKSARYFFIVFIITTLIPLVLMFLWTSKKMQSMRKEHSRHFLAVDIGQLKNSTNMYLRLQEAKILGKTQSLPEGINLEKMKKIFPDEQVSLINYSGNEIVSYYEFMKIPDSHSEVLYSSVVVPVKSQKHSMKFSSKVDLNKIRPFGPFDVELYKGDKITKDSFVLLLPAANMPPPPELGHRHPFHNNKRLYQEPKGTYSTVTLYDSSRKAVATLGLKHFDAGHNGPPGGLPPLQDEFGLLILLTGSCLSFVVGFYIHKNFITPILELSEASKKVQNGDLSFEVSTKVKHDQIQNTYRNFNQMIKDLREKEELRKSFILNLTHDLRTPLFAQERSLSMIAQRFEALGLLDEVELSKSLEKNNQHLLRMVNLILESYSFDSQKIKLDPKPYNLFEMVESCYEKIGPLAIEKNIKLINNIPVDLAPVIADEISMKRVFVNLVSNSIENLNQNGQVVISAEQNQESVTVFVEDNGSGISPKDIQHIFDRYFTGKSLERKLGSGLGLDVCKEIIKLHKGSISVESELNKYTKFIIKLPLTGE